LISQGVPPAQLTTRGFGETQPIASNATVEGRAKNRRVGMHVLENPGDVPIRNEGAAQQIER
jgi:outer membrane protein OmpA-like peptidoglycan-associated protein